MNNISEKHKLYVLITVICIAGIIGYIRFGRPPSADGKQLSTAKTADARGGALPASIDLKHIQSSDRPTQHIPNRNISRNIFEPAGPLPVASASKTAVSASTAETDMTLSGTIIGAHSSIAIINNKFMRQGQQLGKYTITRITPDKVFLTAGADQLCLKVISAIEAISP